MNTLIKKASLVLIALIVFNCSKNDDIEEASTFEKISKSDIEALGSILSNTVSNASNETDGVFWENGKILVYKTNEGRFGKLNVLNIDADDNYKLAIQVVTYDADGSIYNSEDSFEVPGSWSVDLDRIEFTSLLSENTDFQWARVNTFLTRLQGFNGFVFVEYEQE